MNYKYSSEKPELVETSGALRIFNFDIEKVESENEGDQYRFMSAEGNVFNWEYDHLVSAIIRTKYSQDDVEAIILNGDSEEIDALNEWRGHAKDLAAAQFGIDALQRAKDARLREIEAYDKSAAVNSFTMNGVSIWIDKATRVGLVNSTNMLKQIGEETTTLWFGEMHITLPCDTVLAILCQLEVYALACYNVTAQHKAEVSALTTIEAIENYDITKDYPNRLAF